MHVTYSTYGGLYSAAIYRAHIRILPNVHKSLSSSALIQWWIMCPSEHGTQVYSRSTTYQVFQGRIKATVLNEISRYLPVTLNDSLVETVLAQVVQIKLAVPEAL